MALEVGWLWFWRVKPEKKVKPKALFTALQDGKEPAQLEELPVAEILKALKKQYPSFQYNRKVRAGEVDIEEEEMAFELCWSKQHFQFTFFGNAEKHMDRVIDLMASFRLPCYDAGMNKAYPLERPPRFSPSPEEDEHWFEVERIAEEEIAKIKAVTPDQKEQSNRWHEFLRAGGAEFLHKEANRRIQERNKSLQQGKKGGKRGTS